MKYFYEYDQAKIKIINIIDKEARNGSKYRLLVDSQNWSWIVWYSELEFEIGKSYLITYCKKGRFSEVKSIDEVL